MMEELETDIAIVGGGPVGLLLASELAYRGVKSIVIEAKPDPVSIESDVRPIVLHSRSLEHLRRLSLEKRVQSHAYRQRNSIHLSFGTGFLKEKPLLVKHFSSWGDELNNSTQNMVGFSQKDTVCPPFFCTQSLQVTLFADHLKSCPESTVLYTYKAISLSQDNNGVAVKIVKSDDSPGEKLVKARYLVGCDGARSWVRKTLGVHSFGRFEVEGAVRIAFSSPELAKMLIQMNRFGGMYITNKTCRGFLIAVNSEGGFAFFLFCAPKNHTKFYQLVRQNPKKYIMDGIGRNVEVSVEAVYGYRTHAILASKYCDGRVLLAGDAAHQQVQAGGYGLNMGYMDVGNLGWKLAGMVQGWGRPHLLDSYQLERRPIADNSRRTALQYADAAMNPMSQKIIPFCESVFFLRKFLGRMLAKTMKVRFNKGIELMLGYQYTDSNIIVHEFENNSIKIAKQNPFSFRASSLPGCRAPHVALPESPTIHDIFGKGFVLLVIGGAETDCEYLREELKSRGVPFEVRVYPKLPDLLQYYDRKYYLIRPDGDISWRSLSQPSFLEAQHITMRICGDIPHEPVNEKPVKEVGNLDLITKLSLAALVVGMFERYSSVSASGLIAIGLGVATLSTVFRNQSHKTPFIQGVSRHQAWIATKFGPPSAALTMEPSYVGSFGPNDVLIRVRAASVNRIDMGMRSGYGAPLFAGFAHQGGRPLFPLILGRDCSGEVVAVGDEVTGFSPGQEVYTAVSFSRQGTHAQYVAVDESEVSLKPDGIDHREAASLPWVAVTVWTALVKKAGLTKQTAFGKRILVHGGTGGVGSFAVQLLKAWGADVVTTCSGANVTFAHSLGADVAIDYTSGDFSSALTPQSFDIILDTVRSEYEGPSLKLLKAYSNAKYVSIRSPYMQLTSAYGCFMGSIVYQWIYRYKVFINRLFGGRAFYYSIAEPDGNVLDTVRDMVEKGEIRPIIGAVYSKDEMVAAHEHVAGGHTRGKVIVDMS